MEDVYKIIKVSVDPVFFLAVLAGTGFLIALRKRREKAGRVFLLVTFCVLYAISIFPTSNMLFYSLEREYFPSRSEDAGKLDAVIVLGGGTLDNEFLGETQPSSITSSRLLYAVQMFRKTGARYLVCSGRGVTGQSEAEVMATAAKRLGVPGENIFIEAESRNTFEHAHNLYKMFQGRSIRAGLVTSAFHMKRSMNEFGKYFDNIVSLPTDYLYVSSPMSVISFMPRSGNIYRFFIALHEIIGNAWYRAIAS